MDGEGRARQGRGQAGGGEGKAIQSYQSTGCHSVMSECNEHVYTTYSSKERLHHMKYGKVLEHHVAGPQNFHLHAVNNIKDFFSAGLASST